MHAAFAAAALVACGEPQPAPPGAVAVKVVNATPAAGADSLVVARGADTLVVRGADLVLREVILRRDTLVLAPTRLAIPLGGDTVTLVAAAAAAGTYRSLRFEMYPPTPERDSAFLAAHPALARASVHVAGTFSRAGGRRAFVYALDFNEVYEFTVAPALVVGPAGSPPLVLAVDVAKWFLTGDSTALIDPATAGQDRPEANQVRDNIRMSFTLQVSGSP
jgi:hypothetical protein